MPSIRKACASAALIAALVPAAASARRPAPQPIVSESVTIDSFQTNNTGFVGPVATQGYMPAGALYVAEVSGTASYYSRFLYRYPRASRKWTVLCGTPEPHARFLPHHRPNGPVGVDAEFIFSRPWTRRKCLQRPLPRHWGNFQLGSGRGGYTHPAPLGPLLTAPTADHTYAYPLVGAGHAARFRLKDRPRTTDNYGLLKATVRRATAADCADGGYTAFGAATQEDCELLTQ